MKKLLILTMVLLMTLTLGACGKKSEDNQPTDLETKVVESQEETSDEKDVEVETEDESEVESEVEEETKETEEETEDETKVVEKETKETKETEKSTEKTTEKSAEKSTDMTKETSKDTTKPSYTKISDTVYAKSAVNVRSGPDKTHKSLGTLKKGQEVKRIGICDNGWGVIEFGGKKGYVSGNYLVKDKPVKETIEETKAPKATQPKQTQPKQTQPKATEAPKATQPKETKPVETKPVETKPKRATIDQSKFVLPSNGPYKYSPLTEYSDLANEFNENRQGYLGEFNNTVVYVGLGYELGIFGEDHIKKHAIGKALEDGLYIKDVIIKNIEFDTSLSPSELKQFLTSKGFYSHKPYGVNNDGISFRVLSSTPQEERTTGIATRVIIQLDKE